MAAGRSEYEVTDRIGDLARELWGTRVRWPGRIVRSGPHAVLPSGEEPSTDRVIGAGDTVTAHFGPLLAGHGTDYTRTTVLGDDPARLRLREDLPAIFAAGRAVFRSDARITGRQLYAELGALADKAGWSPGRPARGPPGGRGARREPDVRAAGRLHRAGQRPAAAPHDIGRVAGPLAPGDPPGRRACGLRRLAQGAPRSGVRLRNGRLGVRTSGAGPPSLRSGAGVSLPGVPGLRRLRGGCRPVRRTARTSRGPGSGRGRRHGRAVAGRG
ncbi:M24 family metallopeptidase [Streptomyces sp. NBC_00207]|uniref:M24 family metallopeptidase n=1 Tax=Streptomyces sp. NBC_00207 TaxID=2903635 RepID=UPI00386B3D28